MTTMTAPTMISTSTTPTSTNSTLTNSTSTTSTSTTSTSTTATDSARPTFRARCRRAAVRYLELMVYADPTGMTLCPPYGFSPLDGAYAPVPERRADRTARADQLA